MLPPVTERAPRSRFPPPRFVVALVVGSVLAAAFAIAIRFVLERAMLGALGSRNVLEAFRAMPAWGRALAPAVGALLGGVVASVAAARLPESHGVADVMEALVIGRGRVSFRTAVAKAAASFFAILGGGSLGREGPLVQVGAALVGGLGNRLGVDPRRRRILFAAGAAAGFAAAYNTPIAATLFVLEVMAGVFALELVVPVFIAAAIATTLSRAILGEGPFYGLRSFELTPLELLGSVALGPLGGLSGVAFMALLTRSETVFARLVPRGRVLRATLGGAIVGGIAVAVPEITGNGAEAIREMLDGRLLGWTFLLLLVAKPVATACSVGSGSSGGVFTPSMFLGAALGAGVCSLGMGTELAHHPTVGAFALVGLAAVVAATTHAPLLATVLAFEMSGDYALVIPLLFATSLATATARLLRRDSLYAAEAHRKGLAWEGSVTERMARAVRARDVIEPAVVLAAELTGHQVAAELGERRARVGYAVTDSGVRALDVRSAPAAGDRTLGEAGALLEPLAETDGLPSLVERLWPVEWGELPVRGADGSIAGIVTRRGLLGALDRELLSRDLLLTRLTYQGSDRDPLIELPTGYGVAVVPAPAALDGQPLDVTDVRRAHGVWVLAVRPMGARAAWVDPIALQRVAEGDSWLVLGARGAVARLAVPIDTARGGRAP